MYVFYDVTKEAFRTVLYVDRVPKDSTLTSHIA